KRIPVVLTQEETKQILKYHRSPDVPGGVGGCSHAMTISVTVETNAVMPWPVRLAETIGRN
ncbi:MAG: hypothetical protein AB1798_12905, partial [Spirochaetota bacterium]